MIPYGRQDITKDDIESVNEVLESDFLTQGPTIPRFERKLCQFTGANHSVVLNSCTSALHLSCLALGLGPGDILWTSPITFVASANCAFYCGATVDFVDIEPSTGLMSVERLKEKLIKSEKEGKLPKIIIPVHLAGQPCDMEEIYLLGKQYGFNIIEDAAHAIGAEYKGNSVGNCRYSDITVFSFHPVKIITTGEGGAALTNNTELANRMKLLRSHGITRNQDEMMKISKESWYYEQIDLGYNYRMTDIQAALGITQLNKIDKYLNKRKNIAKHYSRSLNLDKVAPLEQKNDRRSSWHLYIIRITGGRNERNRLSSVLNKFEIGVNVHYIPLYKHPYINFEGFLEGAEKYYDSALTIPLFPGISLEDVDYISNLINSNL